MEPNSMIDYLVQHGILNTDENTNLLGQCRAKKCDVILRKLIRSPSTLSELMDKMVDTYQSFRSQTNDTSLLATNLRNEVDGKHDDDDDDDDDDDHHHHHYHHHHSYHHHSHYHSYHHHSHHHHHAVSSIQLVSTT